MPRYDEGSAATYTGFSGDAFVDGLLSGASWLRTGDSTTLTVSFPWYDGAGAFFNYGGEPDAPHGAFTTQQRASVVDALQAWANVANINFVAIEEDAAGNVGDLRIAFTEAVGDWWGWAQYPAGWPQAGDIWVHTRYMGDSFAAGTYNYYAMLHEIGHALGLDHSFDGSYSMPAGFDDRRFTVMSYTDPATVWWYNQTSGQQEYLIAGPMVYDIAAIQFLYGPNMTYRSGDDTYTFYEDQPFIHAIWDAGGTDGIDVTAFTNGCTIDLTPGSYSTTSFVNSPLTQNLGIAFGCTIENVSSGAGSDRITGNYADNVLSGGAGDDWLFGADGDDMLRGQGGNDTLDGGAGINRLDGGGGDDLLINGYADYGSASAGVEVDLASGTGRSRGSNDLAGVGTDELSGLVGAYGSKFDDILQAAASGSILYGQAGNDQLNGGGAADTLDGGGGNDVLAGGGGDDTADYSRATAAVSVDLSLGTAQDSGGSEIDTLLSIENLLGSKYADRLRGSAIANVLDGGTGDDIIHGFAGGDNIDGGRGADKLYGGVGDDTYVVDQTSDAVVELAGEGTDTVLASAAVTLKANVEQLVQTGIYSIHGSGNELANAMTGNSGSNKLYGLGGNDTLTGGAGNDHLDGGSGLDTLTGGLGNDSYVVDSTGDTVSEAAGEGYDLVKATLGWTLADNFERLDLLGATAIDGTGNALGNVLNGNEGANALAGLAGNDKLYGRGGDDTVDGGDGVDWLEGGAGMDVMVGGTGSDRFVFRTGDLGSIAPDSCDVIRDYSYGSGDRIRLDLFDANSKLAGTQDFAFIGAGAFTGVAGQLRYEQADGNTFVSADTNGDGDADFMLQLDGLHALKMGDFIF